MEEPLWLFLAKHRVTASREELDVHGGDGAGEIMGHRALMSYNVREWADGWGYGILV